MTSAEGSITYTGNIFQPVLQQKAWESGPWNAPLEIALLTRMPLRQGLSHLPPVHAVIFYRALGLAIPQLAEYHRSLLTHSRMRSATKGDDIEVYFTGMKILAFSSIGTLYLFV